MLHILIRKWFIKLVLQHWICDQFWDMHWLTIQWYFRGSFMSRALRRQLKTITRNLPLLFISKLALSVRLSSLSQGPAAGHSLSAQAFC
jgi:hypothetical protein